MKVSLLKISRNKEVIKRLELREIAEMIRENPEKDKVYNLRLKYQFYKPSTYPLLILYRSSTNRLQIGGRRRVVLM